MMTEKQNIQRKKVFTQAYKNYERGLLSHAHFKINSTGTSRDLVQDTFLKTWSYLVKGGKIDIMKAFLYHILNNLIIDEYRKNKSISLDALREKGFEVGVDNTAEFLNRLDGKAALILIQRLPFKYQKVMRMRYMQDLSLYDMSLITGETKNSLAVQTYRGLQKLKAIYYSQ